MLLEKALFEICCFLSYHLKKKKKASHTDKSSNINISVGMKHLISLNFTYNLEIGHDKSYTFYN